MRFVFLALLTLSGAAAAQDARVSVSPSSPKPGAFVRLTLTQTSRKDISRIRGTMAGEPLHFTPSGSSRWTALAGVPVDASDSVVATVTLTMSDGSSETLRARASVPKLRVARSRLEVSSRFTEPMDTALTNRIARENAKARATGRHSHDRPRLWTAPFLRPRDASVTSEFGSGRVFNGRVTSRHLGVDFRGKVGEPVRAANRGVVALVDTFFLAGRVIYVDHGQGVLTGYFHLSEALVSVGDTVERGQLIGRVGQSGRVTGPHLHWSARYGALSVNPMDLVTLTEPSTSGRRPRRTPSSSAPAPR